MGLGHKILQFIILVISILGAVVVIWGILEAMVEFFVIKIARARINVILESEAIRQRLDTRILLGLEVFIAASIISLVASPKWERIGSLASLVAIWAVLSYFLRFELKQGFNK
jgi:uncharacterized membrane protein